MPGPDGILQGRLMNSESLANFLLLCLLGHMADDCQAELTDLITEFVCLLTPSRTHLVVHDIVGIVIPIKQRFYCVSLEKLRHLDSGIEYMLVNDIAVPSFSS